MRRVMRLRARSATPSSLMACFTVVFVFSVSAREAAWNNIPHPQFVQAGWCCLFMLGAREMMYHAVCFRTWYLVFALHGLGRKRLRKQQTRVAQALLPVPKHPSEGSKHRQECRCHTSV